MKNPSRSKYSHFNPTIFPAMLLGITVNFIKIKFRLTNTDMKRLLRQLSAEQPVVYFQDHPSGQRASVI